MCQQVYKKQCPHQLVNLQKQWFSHQFSDDMRATQREFMGRFYITNYLQDELYYDHNFDHITGGIKRLGEHFKKNPQGDISIKSHTILVYNTAIRGFNDTELYQQLEKHLYKFKEQYNERLAFGGLYGFYKSNFNSHYALSFFEEEYTRTLSTQNPVDAQLVLEAFQDNTVKTLEQRQNFVDKYLKNLIIENYKYQFAFKIDMELKIIESLIRLKYFDKDLWETIFKSITANKINANKMTRQIQLVETLTKLQKSGLFFRDLNGEIDHFKKRLENKEDAKWRYDLEKLQFRTYDDLLEQSKVYKQQNLKYQFRTFGWFNTEKEAHYHEEFKKMQMNIKDQQADQILQEKQKSLQNLLYEQFRLQQIGEADQRSQDQWISKNVSNEQNEEQQQSSSAEQTDKKKDEKQGDKQNKQKQNKEPQKQQQQQQGKQKKLKK